MTPQEPAMGVSELLPCPFCGEAPKGPMEIAHNVWIVKCARYLRHDANAMSWKSEADAIAAWNTRAALPHMQGQATPVDGNPPVLAGEAVAWQRRCSHKLPNGEYCDWTHATKAEYDRWLARDYPDTLWEYRALVVRATTPPQPSAEEAQGAVAEENRQTPMKIIMQGAPRMSHDFGYLVRGNNEVVTFFVDLESKYCEVCGWGGSGDEEGPTIHIVATENSLHIGPDKDALTAIEFPEFVGWDIHTAAISKYTLAVALTKPQALLATPQPSAEEAQGAVG